LPIVLLLVFMDGSGLADGSERWRRQLAVKGAQYQISNPLKRESNELVVQERERERERERG